MRIVFRLRSTVARLLVACSFVFFASAAQATLVLGYDASLNLVFDANGELNPIDGGFVSPNIPDDDSYYVIGELGYLMTNLPPRDFDADAVQPFILDYEIQGTISDGNTSQMVNLAGWIPLTDLVGDFALNDVELLFGLIGDLVSPCVGGLSGSVGFCSAAGDVFAGSLAFGLKDLDFGLFLGDAPFALMGPQAVDDGLMRGLNGGYLEASFLVSLDLKTVPEPGTLGVLALGLGAIGLIRRRISV
ncbi:MAG: PEP-CTERM sorting domain-containing protein [Pseudomonadota bacterium]